MDRLQTETVELDERLWKQWLEKGRLRERGRKRRWRIIGGVAGGALLLVIGLLGWIGQS